MPHLRQRHLAEPFRKLIAHSRIVGILGHRQVGKTTFLESHSSEYRTLDDSREYKSAKADPEKYLSRLKGHHTAIDECQLVPGLFPALKLRVQKRHEPGQFILSGSVRFTSRKAIRESLTGRIANLELFPLVLTELESEPLSNFLPKLLDAQPSQPALLSFIRDRSAETNLLKGRRKSVELYLKQGGLPGICFVREKSTRERLLRDLVTTLLDRDLRLVHPTNVPFSQLIELCRAIARRPMSLIRWSELHKETSLSEKTLRKLIQALEAIFLIRALPVEGGGGKGSIYLFEDQIEGSFFAPGSSIPLLDRIGLLYRNIRAQFEYRLGFTPTYFHFLTRGGAMMPLAIRNGENVVGILPIDSSSDISRTHKAATDSFLRTYASSKVLFVSFRSFEFEVIDSRTLIAPAEAVLF